MKKFVLITLLLTAVMAFATAQTVVFSDNFDSYTAGSHLAQSNSAWTTWSNLPGSAEDGVISSDAAASSPNSLYISLSNDQVYPFGNYTSGHYTLTFNYYVPSRGNGGYFNIQHILCDQWALECYFHNTGGGYLKVGGTNYNFSVQADNWFPVEFDVDMDNNQATLTIDNVVVHTWPFSYQADNTNGVNQLAGINFYAGSPISNTTQGSYFVDDFVVTEVSAAQVGQFAVDAENLFFSMNPDGTASQTFTLRNPGTGGVDFAVIPTYTITNPNTTSTGVTDLHYYMDEPYTAIGFTSGSDSLQLAIGIPAANLQAHIGKTLNEVGVFLNQNITNAKIRVYGMSNPLLQPGPGAVLYEQAFVPDSGWNAIQLTNPVVIDGGDLWFGVWMVEPVGSYPIYLDGVIANDYSAWYKRGPAWNSHFSSYDYNLMIYGKIDGTPVAPWLTVNPASGSINAGGNVTEEITANSNGMNVNDIRTAILHCYSSDLENDEVTVPVTLSVTDVSVNEHNQIEVKIYPNPATDFVQVTSDQIQRVEIYNMMGQLVFEQNYNDSRVTIPTAGMAPGTYAVKVTATNGTTTKQVIVK